MQPENETITKGDRVEEMRQDRLWFLESMDRINRTIQDTDGFEQMAHVLDTVLSIFGSDRAWIAYPSDSESQKWRTIAERTRPEFRDSVSLRLDLPLDVDLDYVHQVVSGSKAVVRTAESGTNQSTDVDGSPVRLRMCVAVHPKIGRPHIFGLDQFTSTRNWTDREQSLFEATGQRLATLLTTLSMSRDLQKSKARLEEAQRLAHVGHWEWELETGIVVWSAEIFRIYGLTPQDAPVDLATVREMIHPEDREFVFRIAEEAIRSGVRADCEHRVLRPDGEIRTVHSLADVNRDASGRPYQMFGTVQDITDRKRAEEALKRTQFYLAEGERLAHIGSWAFNESGHYWSDELYKIYGLDPQKGAPSVEEYLALIHPQDRASMAETIKLMQEQHRGHDLIERIVRPDGQLRYVRAVAIPVIEQGVFKGFIGTTMDVTEQELLNQELRRQQAYLNEAQSMAHIGSWAYNLVTHKLLHSSDENARLYGFDPNQSPIPSERFFDTLLAEDAPRVLATLESAVRTGTDFYFDEYRIRHADGSTRYLRAVGRPNPSGEFGEYVGITMEITERKRAEEERERLRQLEADLAHINRVNMMGELAAALAHEIKQPIAASVTSANACLRWLAHSPPDLERARAAAARIEQEGNRAADIINSLRSFYKTGTPAERQSVDVKDTIREMTALLRTEAARHSVTIRAEFDADVPHILADRVQVQQVLMNLMLNAIEAMKDSGGVLTIGSGVNPEGHLIVSISDSGVGLPAEGADLIFDPFHTTKPQGTGMGLTISRSIVESYGGQVWATPNQEAGATFHFTLPAGAEAHA